MRWIPIFDLGDSSSSQNGETGSSGDAVAYYIVNKVTSTQDDFRAARCGEKKELTSNFIIITALRRRRERVSQERGRNESHHGRASLRRDAQQRY